MAEISEESPIAGKSLGELYRQLSGRDFQMISIGRREHLILPHGDTLLVKGDHLVVIASLAARELLSRFLQPRLVERVGGIQNLAPQTIP